MNDPDSIESVITQLRAVEIHSIESSEVDRFKEVRKDGEEEEEKDEKPERKLDILDDPVRMYFKQMGQVPLLTREQEVKISKRIEGGGDQSARKFSINSDLSAARIWISP